MAREVPTLAAACAAVDRRALAAAGGELTHPAGGIGFGHGQPDRPDAHLAFSGSDLELEEILREASAMLPAALQGLHSGVPLGAVIAGAFSKGLMAGLELARLRAAAGAREC